MLHLPAMEAGKARQILIMNAAYLTLSLLLAAVN
jgi:hypothetical protein